MRNRDYDVETVHIPCLSEPKYRVVAERHRQGAEYDTKAEAEERSQDLQRRNGR